MGDRCLKMSHAAVRESPENKVFPLAPFRSPLAPLKKRGTGLKVILFEGRTGLKVFLKKGRTGLKVPLFKGDLGGSKTLSHPL